MNHLLTFLFAFLLLVSTSDEVGAATLSVTNYGAIGDATNFTANCVSNSAIIHTSIALPTNAAWAIQVIGAGTNTFGSTTNSDFLGWITNVVNGTNIYADRACRWTTNLANAFAGTFCSTGIQACVNAAIGGDVIDFPGGNYFTFASTFMDATRISGGDFAQIGAVIIKTNGIKFLGHPGTVLTGLGAFVHTASWTNVHRGYTFYISGPVSNPNTTLTFQDLTFDGGLAPTANHGFPANAVNGDGWDVTQGAIFLNAPGNNPVDFIFPTNTIITGCTFRNWRGEMVKGGPDFQTANYFAVTNCYFLNGNASGWNMQFAHALHGCTFSNLFLTFEDNQSTSLRESVFEFNYVTNCTSGVVIVGASTNRQPQVRITVQSNSFQVANSAINPASGENIWIQGNHFRDGNAALFIGSGAPPQGTAPSSNIVFINNTITNETYVVEIYDGQFLYVSNNIFDAQSVGSRHFADSVGGAPYGNSFFVSNRMVNATTDGSSYGFYFNASTVAIPLDDPSDNFPQAYADSTSGIITYRHGYRHSVKTVPGSGYVVCDTSTVAQVPSGALMLLTNECGSDVLVYYDSGGAQNDTIQAGKSWLLRLNQARTEWTTNAPPPPPPGGSGGTITVVNLKIGP